MTRKDTNKDSHDTGTSSTNEKTQISTDVSCIPLLTLSNIFYFSNNVFPIIIVSCFEQTRNTVVQILFSQDALANMNTSVSQPLQGPKLPIQRYFNNIDFKKLKYFLKR